MSDDAPRAWNPPPPPPPPPPAHAPLPAAANAVFPTVAPSGLEQAGAALDGPDDASTQRSPWWIGLAAAVAGIVVGMVVWVASKDALRRTPVDGHHVWVPLASFATVGAVWGITHPGSRRPVRALLGLLAGAGVGALGGLLIGSTKIHLDAVGDEVVSGATIGRGLIWAAVGAVAWAATVGIASPRSVAGRAATGAAIGGAAIGAAMGVLAATPLGSDQTVLADAWFTGWYAFDPKLAHVAPILVLSLIVPVALATWSAGARRSVAPLSFAVLSVLALPALALLAGHGTDIDRARRDGERITVDEPGLPGIADSDEDDSSTASADDDASTSEASSSAAVTIPSPPTVAASPLPAPPTSPTMSASTDDEAAAPATSPASAPPSDEPPSDAPASDAPAVEVTQPTVAVDIDPGFPVIIQHRFSGSNAVGEGFQGQMLIGAAAHDDLAPPAPDFGEVCAIGANDAVFPFYLEVTPYDANISEVRITMSQTVVGIADAATFPMSIQFNDLAGPRCVAATSNDIVATPSAVQWDTLADGETGGEYGYLVVANYFDAAGGAPGGASAVLAVGYELNHSATTWSTQTYGTTTIDYDQGNGSAGTGFYLVP